MAPPEEEDTTTRTTRRLSRGDEGDFPDDSSSSSSSAVQYLYIIRHGDRWDYENKEWSKSSPRPGDPPLSQLGHQQARETGLFLNELLVQDGITSVDDITWLSSPFLRCLQTSDTALNAMTSSIDTRKISILPEYSVFEWDAKGGDWHASLPPLEERRHYFPRLAWQYQSLFVPPLPEVPRQVLFARCDRAMAGLHERFPYCPQRKSTALVIVTHAATCIGLVQAATQGALADINPAAPCGVYRLTRNSANQTRWTMDAAAYGSDDDDAMHNKSTTTNGRRNPRRNLNGHTDHLSFISPNTIAWNHFGDKNHHRGYTGPPTSKFAPPELRREIMETRGTI